MTRKPGWTFWFGGLAIYTVSYMLFELILHGAAAWARIPGALTSGIVSTTLTWLFAYRRWAKSDSLY